MDHKITTERLRTELGVAITHYAESVHKAIVSKAQTFSNSIRKGSIVHEGMQELVDEIKESEMMVGALFNSIDKWIILDDESDVPLSGWEYTMHIVATKHKALEVCIKREGTEVLRCNRGYINTMTSSDVIPPCDLMLVKRHAIALFDVYLQSSEEK